MSKLRKKPSKGKRQLLRTPTGQVDPSRTATLRRVFERALTARFTAFSRKVVDLIAVQDVFGLKRSPLTFNADCGTGAGGFKKGNTCAKGGGGPDTGTEPRERPDREIHHLGVSKVVHDLKKSWKYKEDVDVLDQDGREFEVGGVKWREGGNCHLDTGKVTIHSGTAGESVKAIERLTAHEFMHGAYEKTHKRYEEERKKLEEPADTKSGVKMRMDGDPYPQFAGEVPTYARLHQFLSNYNRAKTDDGVSEYSKAYWRDHEAGKVPFHIAVHETLAEIAGIHQSTGKVEGSKFYRDYYKAVRDEYRVISGSQKERRGAGLAANEIFNHVLYLDATLQPVSVEKAVYLRWWRGRESGWAVRSDKVERTLFLEAPNLVSNHVLFRGICINCGGKGSGKPGPCPQGTAKPTSGGGEKKGVISSIKAKVSAVSSKLSALADKIPGIAQLKKAVSATMGFIFKKLEGRYGAKAAKIIMGSGSVGGYGVMAAATKLLGFPGVPVVNDLISIAAHTAIAEGVLQLGRAGRAIGRGVARLRGKRGPVANAVNQLELSGKVDVLIEKAVNAVARRHFRNIEAALKDPENRKLAEEVIATYKGKEEPTTNAPGVWGFRNTTDQMNAFLRWMEDETGETILGNPDFLNRYIQEGFDRGMGRSFDDARRSGTQPRDAQALRREEFLRSAFSRPVAQEKVKLLISRAYSDLQGITEAMSRVLARTLMDGLIAGKGAEAIARDIVRNIEGIGKVRARTLARTEIIRAHAEGQLEALSMLGVKEVEVGVEWSVAHHKVCPLCLPMSGIVFKVEEARGLIPRHPNCRCAWRPFVVGKPTDAKRVRQALEKSQSLQKRTRWAAGTVISEDRPNTLLNNIAVDLAKLSSFELALNNCGTGAGGFKKGNNCASGGTSFKKGDTLPDGRKVLSVTADGGYVVKGPFGRSTVHLDSGVGASPTAPKAEKVATPTPSKGSHVEQAKEAFSHLEKEKGYSTIPLADLRDRLPHLSREDFAKVVNDLRKSGEFVGGGYEGRVGLPDRVRDSFVWDSPKAKAEGDRPIAFLSRRQK